MRAREGTARRYAKALHGLARERGFAAEVATDLARFAELVAGQPDARDVLTRPWIKAEDRRRVAAALASAAGCGRLVADFVALVADRGRMDHLAEIVRAYQDFVDDDLGQARATVRTAVALTDGEKNELSARLGRAVGKRIIVDEHVDPTLLGGFVAQVGSFIVDGSIDGQLARMRDRLARG